MELDAGIVERDVGAALNVGRAAVFVVDRLAVDRNVHDVKFVGALRTNLLVEAGDVHAFVIVERHGFVIHGLHAHERFLAVGEASIHNVVGLNVAASLVLRASTRQNRLFDNDFHRVARSRCGKADIVAIHGGGAAVEALVLRVTNKPQSSVGPARDVCQGTTQVGGVAGRNDRLAVRKLERRDASPGRIVDLGHYLLNIARAELRLLRQLLERIVVPEFHFDTTIQRPSLLGFVRGDRL